MENLKTWKIWNFHPSHIFVYFDIIDFKIFNYYLNDSHNLVLFTFKHYLMFKFEISVSKFSKFGYLVQKFTKSPNRFPTIVFSCRWTCDRVLRFAGSAYPGERSKLLDLLIAEALSCWDLGLLESRTLRVWSYITLRAFSLSLSLSLFLQAACLFFIRKWIYANTRGLWFAY